MMQIAWGTSQSFLERRPPNTKYRISAFRTMHANPVIGPSQRTGNHMIQGIANGNSRMPDSPESAGFLDATKNIQQKMATIRNKNKPLTIMPTGDHLILSFNMPSR